MKMFKMVLFKMSRAFTSSKWLQLTVLAIVAIITACTSNPLDDNNTIDDATRRMTGKVSIADGASPEGVFVWMKGLNLSAHTDENGEYSFLLSDGVVDRSGAVQRDTLYYYLSNYRLERRYVDIIQGAFKFASADLNENGEAREVAMQRVVNIRTGVSFHSNSTDPTAPDTVRILTRLSAESGCAVVHNPFLKNESQRADGDTTAFPLGAVLIRKIGSEVFYVVRSTDEDLGAERLVPCSYNTIHRKLDFFAEDIGDVGLPKGQYEAVPYLWLEPEGALAALLDAIGRQKNELSANYFDKPMKRIGGTFEIK
ncbi:MAG: hypothetical protein H6695_15030 [Deferribacteres bacterium]|nr:hypothetical protein [Deferribacteres bacterium]